MPAVHACMPFGNTLTSSNTTLNESPMHKRKNCSTPSVSTATEWSCDQSVLVLALLIGVETGLAVCQYHMLIRCCAI